MKKVKVIEGVVAEYGGKYWGTQYEDGRVRVNDFGDLEKAHISNPEYCKGPTDMARGQHEHEKLRKATLVKVRRTITTERIVEILP